MTPAVVLVEHPIPTSERRECRGAENAHQPGGGWVAASECEWEGPDDERHETRSVTVAGPVWVPLNGVPCINPRGNHLAHPICEVCGGAGVIAPSWDGITLLATRRYRVCEDGVWGEWREPFCGHAYALSRGTRPSTTERRQVIQWKAHDKLLLPVVDALPPFEGNGWECVTVEGPWPLHRVWPGFGSVKGGWVDGLSNAPWAASLRPGMFVARFDGLEAVEPAITRMPYPDRPKFHKVTDRPLDLQPGVVNHIEVPVGAPTKDGER